MIRAPNPAEALYFLSATNVPLPTDPYSAVPSIFVGLLMAPEYLMVPASEISKLHCTALPLTVPVTLASPSAPEYVPVSWSPDCFRTNVAVPLPASSVTAAFQVPEMSAARAAAENSARARKIRIMGQVYPNLRPGGIDVLATTGPGACAAVRCRADRCRAARRTTARERR